MIRFILACWDLSSLWGPLSVQIGCTEHITTITRSERKYFAGGVNPHDENVFGVLIETFGTLNLNISRNIIKGHSVRTSRNNPDQNARMQMLIYNFTCSAFLLAHARHVLQK